MKRRTFVKFISFSLEAFSSKRLLSSNQHDNLTLFQDGSSHSLYVDDKEQAIIQLFLRHPEIFTAISRLYPWTEQLLIELESTGLIDWDSISWNCEVLWTESLLQRFNTKLVWHDECLGLDLSGNTKIPWSIELIELYYDKWNWGCFGLSTNSSLPWSITLIELYEDEWDWYVGLSENQALPWSTELIERFLENWNWGSGGGLSSNVSLPWSTNFINRYIDRWNWGKDGLSSNPSLPWSYAFIEHYHDLWDWDALSKNTGLPWSSLLIERYEKKWTWSGFYSLSNNSELPWSKELIEQFYNKWDWMWISKNHGISFTPELIYEFKDRLSLDLMSFNSKIIWTEKLIKDYIGEWNWGGLAEGIGLSMNVYLPWSIEFIEKYSDKWQWNYSGISGNDGIPWSIELLECCDIKGWPLSWDYLDAPNLFASIDEELIVKIATEINHKQL